MITAEQLQDIAATIENEGFNYAFVHYSAFGEVEDRMFRSLRQAYIDAEANLEEYLQEQGIQEYME